MNTYQTKLYADLMDLVQNNEAFYYQDFNLADKTYRIFNYRLASYTDFQQPGAMECRGTMFEVINDSEFEAKILYHDLKPDSFVPIRLAAMPMEKFFNLYENPMTMDLDLGSVVEIYEKADGSLISTYMHNDDLLLKSKGSLFSDVAVAAMDWLDDHRELQSHLASLTRAGYTINLEWCGPGNRIVLGYLESTLKILNMRNIHNGDYDDAIRYVSWAQPYLVESVDIDHTFMSSKEFVDSIPQMTGIEGYVLVLYSGQRVKVECEWYLGLHRAKDSVTNPRRLFECILEGGIDDIRVMFRDDPAAIEIMKKMEAKVDHLYNDMVKTVDAYHEDNKDLIRKDYAIKAKAELSHMHFGLAMMKYTGKEFSYKASLKSKWKDLGLKDES